MGRFLEVFFARISNLRLAHYAGRIVPEVDVSLIRRQAFFQSQYVGLLALRNIA
jgi:hypothetical protein